MMDSVNVTIDIKPIHKLTLRLAETSASSDDWK
jgi:hypothetical protein